MKATTIKVLTTICRENGTHTGSAIHISQWPPSLEKCIFKLGTYTVPLRHRTTTWNRQWLRSFEFKYFKIWSGCMWVCCLLGMLLAKSKIFVLQSINYARGFKFQAKICSVLQLFPVFNHTEHRLHAFIAIINIWEINMSIARLKHCGVYENAGWRFDVSGSIILRFLKQRLWVQNVGTLSYGTLVLSSRRICAYIAFAKAKVFSVVCHWMKSRSPW